MLFAARVYISSFEIHFVVGLGAHKVDESRVQASGIAASRLCARIQHESYSFNARITPAKKLLNQKQRIRIVLRQ